MTLVWAPPADASGAERAARSPGDAAMVRIFGRSLPPEVAYAQIEAGLPVDTLARLIDAFGRDPVLDTIGISVRTYERRRADGRLTRDEGDRAYRVARLYALAADVLESEDAAHAWMTTPAVALGDRAPLDASRNDAGARTVADLLHRIEYGVYS